MGMRQLCYRALNVSGFELNLDMIVVNSKVMTLQSMNHGPS